MRRKSLANVLIVEVPSETGADKVVESLKKDSAQLRQRAEGRRRTIEAGLNKNRRRNAEQDKATALKIAADLKRGDQTLEHRRKTDELARRVQRKWPPNRTRPSIRSLRRYLTGK